jgi:uncharacterized membrane protein YbaN (DUF454 family)
MRASSLHERRYLSPACRAEESNRWHRWLLRARRKRPRLQEAQKNASIHPSSGVIRGLIFARCEYLGTLAAPR